jgi:hypothetical protein
LLQLHYNEVVMQLLAIAVGLSLIFSALVYD